MIDILYRDRELILVRKPCGMSSQPGERSGRDLVGVLEEELDARPFPLHRLDRDTEGVMALALDKGAASRWATRLEEGAASKRYLAIVAGAMEEAQGEISGDIVQRGRTVTALTKWRRLAVFTLPEGSFSLLELSLGTGRMHQIRIHLAGCGHPILGDDKHGDFGLNKTLKASLGIRKLLLTARELRLRSEDGREIGALCPWPAHFNDFLSRASPGTSPEDLEARIK